MSTLCYIDPASTALIWQVLAGIFISLGVVFGVFWRKITTFFKSVWVKLFRKNKNQEEQKSTDEAMLEVEDSETEIAENVENAEIAENVENAEIAENVEENQEVSNEDNTETENK